MMRRGCLLWKRQAEEEEEDEVDLYGCGEAVHGGD